MAFSHRINLGYIIFRRLLEVEDRDCSGQELYDHGRQVVGWTGSELHSRTKTVGQPFSF